MEIIITDVVKRIDLILDKKGDSKKNLANNLGFNSHVFVDWTYKNQMPSAERMYKIAKYLGVTVEYLLTGEDCMPDDIAIACSYMNAIDKEKRLPILTMIRSLYDLYQNTSK